MDVGQNKGILRWRRYLASVPRHSASDYFATHTHIHNNNRDKCCPIRGNASREPHDEEKLQQRTTLSWAISESIRVVVAVVIVVVGNVVSTPEYTCLECIINTYQCTAYSHQLSPTIIGAQHATIDKIPQSSTNNNNNNNHSEIKIIGMSDGEDVAIFFEMFWRSRALFSELINILLAQRLLYHLQTNASEALNNPVTL